MLGAVKFDEGQIRCMTEHMREFCEKEGHAVEPDDVYGWEEVRPGVYVGPLNAKLFVVGDAAWDDFVRDGKHDCELARLGVTSATEGSLYGVCDSVEQFLERVVPSLEAAPVECVAFLCVMRKEDQDPEGGWRWHKWGPYIGDLEPQREYLYDEPVISQAVCFHIWTKKKVA